MDIFAEGQGPIELLVKSVIESSDFTKDRNLVYKFGCTLEAHGRVYKY
jgi:hypothetical protein